MWRVCWIHRVQMNHIRRSNLEAIWRTQCNVASAAAHHREVPLLRRHEQRRRPLVVVLVHRGPGLDQHCHNLHVALPRRDVDRRALQSERRTLNAGTASVLDPPFGLSLGGRNACRNFKTTSC